MTSSKVTLIYFFIAMYCLASCASKDEESPAVTILTPAAGSIYQALDTVEVSFEAQDNNQLEWTSVKIVDENFIPVSSVSVNEESGTLTNRFESVVLDDKSLQTGDYYVLVTASDGTNEQLEYTEIKIIALPKKRLGIYFSDYVVGLPGRIFQVDSLFQNTLVWSQPNQDIRKLCVNSIKDQLTIIGHFSTGIKNYNLLSGSEQWSDEVFSVAQTERFLDLVCLENSVFTATYDRELRSYNSFGGLTMNIATGIYRPESIYVNGDYIVVEMNLVGDNDRFIFVYNSSTRTLLWQLDVPMDVVSICSLRNDDEVLLFGNDGGNAKVLHYDIGANAYWQPRQLPSGQLMDAAKTEGEKFVISHADGIYLYTYSPNYLNLIEAGKVYQQVLFDEDKGTILGASNSSLEEFSLTGQLLNTVVHSDSITSFDIHYTR